MIYSSSDVVSITFPLARSEIADVSANDQDLIPINFTKKAWEVMAGEADTLISLTKKAYLEVYISTPIPTITTKQKLFSYAVFLLYVSLRPASPADGLRSMAPTPTGRLPQAKSFSCSSSRHKLT